MHAGDFVIHEAWLTISAWFSALSRTKERVQRRRSARPSRERHRVRRAEAPSMPAAPRDAGSKRTERAPVRSARHAESMGGVEHSGSIEREMAGRQAAA